MSDSSPPGKTHGLDTSSTVNYKNGPLRLDGTSGRGILMEKLHKDA